LASLTSATRIWIQWILATKLARRRWPDRMQNLGFISVPFKTESAHGLTSYNGVAKFSPAGIVLEFESKLLGLIPGGVKEVRIPVSELLDIKFKKGFFKRGAKIEFRTRTFSVLAALP